MFRIVKMKLSVQNADEERLFLDLEDHKLVSSEDLGATGLAQTVQDSPMRAARSLSYAEVTRNTTSSRSPPRSYAEVLGSGMLEGKTSEDHPVEQSLGTEYFDELDFPALESRPHEAPSRRLPMRKSQGGQDVPLSNPRLSYHQPTHHRPLVGRSLTSSCADKCRIKKTCLPRFPDRASNGRKFVPREVRSDAQMTNRTSKKKRSKARCPPPSPWDPSFVIRRCTETPELSRKQPDVGNLPSHYQDFMNDTADLGQRAASAYTVGLDLQGPSDPTRFSLTNQRVRVEEHSWTFDANEFQQFNRADFPAVFWSRSALAGRGFYDPFTSKLNPEEWFDHCVPPVS